MFDILPDDILRLDDEALRELVAKLAKAEIERKGHSSLHVGPYPDKHAWFDSPVFGSILNTFPHHSLTPATYAGKCTARSAQPSYTIAAASSQAR